VSVLFHQKCNFFYYKAAPVFSCSLMDVWWKKKWKRFPCERRQSLHACLPITSSAQTNCSSKLFTRHTELFHKVSFGKLFRTPKTNSKQTLFWPDFVWSNITAVHSFISLEFYIRYWGSSEVSRHACILLPMATASPVLTNHLLSI